jgi:hypothetical protein
MTPQDQPRSGAAHAGGLGGAGSIVHQGSAARLAGDAAADLWPSWARPQLLRAVQLAAASGERGRVESLLYREWFNPAVAGVDLFRFRRPLAGMYRAAHAGTARRVRVNGMLLVDRHDVVGADGWWRTWGEHWTPPRSRPGSIRVLLTPRPDKLAALVATVTEAMLDSTEPWALACTTDLRRLRRVAPAVLDIRALDALPAQLRDRLPGMLRAITPPLCLPVAPGMAVATYPDNGMAFGEHRCHLIATALRHPSSAGDPLRAIAAVFAAHGIDPAAPHRPAR